MDTTWYRSGDTHCWSSGINYKMYKDKQAREVNVNNIFPKAKRNDCEYGWRYCGN